MNANQHSLAIDVAFADWLITVGLSRATQIEDLSDGALAAFVEYARYECGLHAA